MHNVKHQLHVHLRMHVTFSTAVQTSSDSILPYLARDVGLSNVIPKGECIAGRSSSLSGGEGEERVEDVVEEEEREGEIERRPWVEERVERFRGR